MGSKVGLLGIPGECYVFPGTSAAFPTTQVLSKLKTTEPHQPGKKRFGAKTRAGAPGPATPSTVRGRPSGLEAGPPPGSPHARKEGAPNPAGTAGRARPSPPLHASRSPWRPGRWTGPPRASREAGAAPVSACRPRLPRSPLSAAAPAEDGRVRSGRAGAGVRLCFKRTPSSRCAGGRSP